MPGVAGGVWNRALALKKESWEREFPWLTEAPSQALQQVHKDLDQAFRNFFRRCKEVPVAPRITGSAVVGIDRGVATFAALSDGTQVKGPEPGKKARRKLATLQRDLARKRKYSKNWRKQRARIQKLHAHIAHVRRDFLQKLSTTIVQNHAVVVLEALKTRNMTQSAQDTKEEPGRNVRAKAGLNRAILDQGWHAFETMVAYKLSWRAGELVKVPAPYTSQTCAVCGDCRVENRLSQEAFKCRPCGHAAHAAHADVNAAQNILAAGHVVKACGGDSMGNPTKQETQPAKAAYAE